MRWDLYQGFLNWLKKPNINIFAKDESGEDVSLSAIKDDEGRAVLRTVDAAPYAYNPQSDSLRVESSNKESVIQTLVQDLDIPANSALNVPTRFIYDGESKVYVAVSIDKAPWRMAMTRAEPWEEGYSTVQGFYPQANNINKSFSMNNPYICIPLIVGFWSDENLQDSIESFSDALQIQLKNDFSIRMFNDSDEDAKVTIKIYRMYD